MFYLVAKPGQLLIANNAEESKNCREERSAFKVGDVEVLKEVGNMASYLANEISRRV